MMTSYPWEWALVNKLIIYCFFGLPVVILGIFLYNALKENKIKAWFYGLVIPALIFLGTLGMISETRAFKGSLGTFPVGPDWARVMFFLALALLIFVIITVKERPKLVKSVLYGLGIGLLMFPAPLCIFVSPIYARIGFGVGAILIYKAFGMKIEKVKKQIG